MRFQYSYEFKGELYSGKDYSNQYTQGRKVGDEIELLVNPENPRKSYIYAPEFAFFSDRIVQLAMLALIIMTILGLMWFFLRP